MALINMLESAARRDRVFVLIALGLVVALAWAYTLSGAGMPSDHADDAMPGMDMRMGEGAVTWTALYAATVFFMWWAMMLAMMLPSAVPMVLLFAAFERSRAATSQPVRTALFVAGYLAVWTAFSLVAVGFQWLVHLSGQLSSDMALASRIVAAGALVVAGVYQWTPLKHACLKRCRSPAEFLSRFWQPGLAGAFLLGLRHGAFCLGCCWLLMALLFVGGVMNLWWIAGLAVYVFLEKLAPWGELMSRVAGAALVVAGAAVGWTAL